MDPSTSSQTSMGMDNDAFKPKKTLGRTPPNSPKASGKASRDESESDKSEDTGGGKDDLNKTEEVDSDTDDGEEQGNRDETRVQRLNSYKYKPFGARAASGKVKKIMQNVKEGQAKGREQRRSAAIGWNKMKRECSVMAANFGFTKTAKGDTCSI